MQPRRINSYIEWLLSKNNHLQNSKPKNETELDIKILLTRIKQR